MTTLGLILLALLNVAWWIIIIHIIIGWLVQFQVLNMRQPLVSQIYFGLNQLLEPIYGPIRRFLPAAGGLDFAPLVVFLGIVVLRIFITQNMVM
ncbi:MAG: YggT family protein [Pseudomonadota bacterium]